MEASTNEETRGTEQTSSEAERDGSLIYVGTWPQAQRTSEQQDRMYGERDTTGAVLTSQKLYPLPPQPLYSHGEISIKLLEREPSKGLWETDASLGPGLSGSWLFGTQHCSYQSWVGVLWAPAVCVLLVPPMVGHLHFHLGNQPSETTTALAEPVFDLIWIKGKAQRYSLVLECFSGVLVALRFRSRNETQRKILFFWDVIVTVKCSDSLKRRTWSISSWP